MSKRGDREFLLDIQEAVQRVFLYTHINKMLQKD